MNTGTLHKRLDKALALAREHLNRGKNVIAFEVVDGSGAILYTTPQSDLAALAPGQARVIQQIPEGYLGKGILHH